MYDITKRRARETGQIELVNGDGVPMLDDNGKPMFVTVHGPGSKLWQQADAEKRRRAAVRVEKRKGRISAAMDHSDEDLVDFLTTITISFDGWEYPHPDAANGGKWASQRDMFHAAYSDDSIGYIRDHVNNEANDWSAFTKGSATS